MNFSNQTVLITGGSSGIGLALAKQLIAKGNKVIICGRSLERLEKAKTETPALHIFACDISKEEDSHKLAKWVDSEHPDCHVLINNAAIVHQSNFYQEENIVEQAKAEFATNFLGPIRLAKLFLPILEKHTQAQIINITTGLVYTPRIVYPFYSATKAALHSFTQVLRRHLASTNVAVIEVMFPAVDTPWHKGNPPKIAISPQKAVAEMIQGLEKGRTEIQIGKVKLLYILSRIAPKFAFSTVNNL